MAGLGGTAASAATDCAGSYLDHTPPALMGSVPGSTLELCFTHFAMLSSSATLTALWSAEHLTAEEARSSDLIELIDSFRAEDRLPAEQTASLADYGDLDRKWDLGHLTPAEDAPDPAGQAEASTLANVVPQAKKLNQRQWRYLEASLHALAERDGELYLVTGPIFFANPQRLHDRVAIPAYMFKAVYNPKTRQAIAYVAGNVNEPVCWVVSIRQLIEMSGIDPFPSLSTEVKSDATPWPLPRGAQNLPSPDCRPAT